jgi:hypothetical protein
VTSSVSSNRDNDTNETFRQKEDSEIFPLISTPEFVFVHEDDSPLIRHSPLRYTFVYGVLIMNNK